MAKVVLDAIDKVYSNGFHAVQALSLEIEDGEFLVLVGPSGCGKSTALRMIAGLEAISGGKLIIGDTVVNDVPPKDRDIAMVFQSYALYPHMSVRDNIAFALKLRHEPREEIARRVEEVARVLELTEVLDRKPAQLSGGQRQRVAMGRAIVRKPKAFLMDEPLSNLDAKLRVAMRAEIARLQRSLAVTTVYVTHDQIEAMTMGDRVAVLSGGVLQQVDTPQRLYDRPDNIFVAAFIGSPQMNLMEGSLRCTDDGGALISLGRHELRLSPADVNTKPALRDHDGRPVIVGIRPEDVVEGTDADESVLRGPVDIREGLGSEVVVHLRLDANLATTGLEDADADHSMFVARLDPRTELKVGDVAVLRVATDRVHVFDPTTSLAIR